MFDNNAKLRVRIATAVSAAALVAAALGLNVMTTQAQDNPTPTPAPPTAATAAATPSIAGKGGLFGGGHLPGSRFGIDFRKTIVDAVTQATDLTEAQLTQEVMGGKSISDVITAHNGDPKAVQATVKTNLTTQINAAVTAGTIKQTAADKFTANLDNLLNRVFSFTVPGAKDRATRLLRGVAIHELLAETATETKLSAQAVVKALTAGQTLSQITTANNADPAAIVTAVAQKVTDRINAAVKRGKLTQTQADTLLAGLNTSLTALMNQANPLLPAGAGGGRGPGLGAPQPTAAATTAGNPT